jgi:phospholipase/carboxylesterase
MREGEYGGLHVRIRGGCDGNGGGDGPLVVLLHGFGAPGTDLVDLARYLKVPPEVRFAFPEAPLDLSPMNPGGRAWWWIDMMANQIAAMRGEPIDRSKTVPEGLTEAREKAVAMLGALENELRPSSLVLGGFSQGAMLSCDVAMRTEIPLAALVLFSAAIIGEHEWAPTAARRRGLRAVVSHGKSDPVLPFDAGEKLRDFLTSAGLGVTWVPFRGGHEIPGASLEAASLLIRESTAA